MMALYTCLSCGAKLAVGIMSALAIYPEHCPVCDGGSDNIVLDGMVRAETVDEETIRVRAGS